MDTRSAELYSLLGTAERQVSAEKDAQQVIAVKTAKGNVYHFPNHCVGEPSEEDTFLEMLLEQGDAEIQYILCMWHNYQLDVPSLHFRRRLVEICPRNKDAVVLLLGENAFHAKRVEQLMPR